MRHRWLLGTRYGIRDPPRLASNPPKQWAHLTPARSPSKKGKKITVTVD